MKNKLTTILNLLNSKGIDSHIIHEIDSAFFEIAPRVSMVKKQQHLGQFRDELERVIRDVIQDRSKSMDLALWVSDVMIPKIVIDRNFQFTVESTTTLSEENYLECITTQVAEVIFKVFSKKNLYHLQECGRCKKIYVPKRLHKEAKYCSYGSCKQRDFLNQNPEKISEYQKSKIARTIHGNYVPKYWRKCQNLDCNCRILLPHKETDSVYCPRCNTENFIGSWYDDIRELEARNYTRND